MTNEGRHVLESRARVLSAVIAHWRVTTDASRGELGEGRPVCASSDPQFLYCSFTHSLARSSLLSLSLSSSLSRYVNRRRFLRFSLLPSVFHARRRCDGAAYGAVGAAAGSATRGKQRVQWSKDTIMDYCCSSALFVGRELIIGGATGGVTGNHFLTRFLPRRPSVAATYTTTPGNFSLIDKSFLKRFAFLSLSLFLSRERERETEKSR